MVCPWSSTLNHCLLLSHMLGRFSCVCLYDPMDCSLPGSSVHGISQARILEWLAISYPRASSQSRDRTHVCYVSTALADRFLTANATWEGSQARDYNVPGKPGLLASFLNQRTKRSRAFFGSLSFRNNDAFLSLWTQSRF